MNFFLNIKSKGSQSGRVLQAVALGLAFVYYYRQSEGSNRFFSLKYLEVRAI